MFIITLSRSKDIFKQLCYWGVDYSGKYGIESSINSLKLVFVKNGSCLTNIESKIYFLKDESHYQIFDLKNKEFAFTVDDFNLDCETNGTLYFVSMDEYGWTSIFSIKKAETKHGTEYRDTKCSHDIKFINGEANV
jgi:cellulose 1,4-beta-cellobiosidase